MPRGTKPLSGRSLRPLGPFLLGNGGEGGEVSLLIPALLCWAKCFADAEPLALDRTCAADLVATGLVRVGDPPPISFDYARLCLAKIDRKLSRTAAPILRP